MDFGVVFNPFSGRGKARAFRDYLKKRLVESDSRFVWVETRKASDGIAITDFFLEKGIKKILVCGGDGTINECATSIVKKKSDAHIFVLPLGIGNDFARSLKLPDDLKLLVDIFLKEKYLTKTVDYGKINGRVFVNNCGIGFDGSVTKLAERMRNTDDPYTRAAMRKILFYRGFKAKVRIDGVLKVKGDLLLVVVSNGEYYGRGIKIIPGARIDDGFFNVLVVENVSVFKRIPLFNAVKKGTHQKRGDLKFFKGKSVEIDLFDKSVDGHTDGLYFSLTDVQRITIDKGLKVAYSLKGDEK